LLRLWVFSDPASLPPLEIGQMLNADGGACQIALGIGIGAAEGQAIVLSGRSAASQASALETIEIVGSGMTRIVLNELQTDGPARTPLNWLAASGLYSRVIGALGMTTFARLQRSSIAIVGAGGLGSQMASGLARLMGQAGHL